MKTTSQKQPYITEEEFNRIVANRGSAQPEDDSKGDSAIDETVEAEFGLEGADLDEIEEEDHGRISGETDEDKIDEKISNRAHRGSSSTWPNPEDFSIRKEK